MPLIYTLKYETIKFADGELSVRGLGILELQQLVAVHTDAAVTLFNEISALSKQERIDIAKLITGVAQRFSSVVAHAIAMAADEPDRYEDYLRLHVDVQWAAIEKIVQLSFGMDGGAKKFFQTVVASFDEKVSEDGLKKAVALGKTFMSGSGISEAN